MLIVTATSDNRFESTWRWACMANVNDIERHCGTCHVSSPLRRKHLSSWQYYCRTQKQIPRCFSPKRHSKSSIIFWNTTLSSFGNLALLLPFGQWDLRLNTVFFFTGCFRNILLSLANKHQLMVAYYQSHAVKPSLAVTKTTEVSLDVIKDDPKDLVKCRFPSVTAVLMLQIMCSF